MSGGGGRTIISLSSVQITVLIVHVSRGFVSTSVWLAAIKAVFVSREVIYRYL